MSSEYLRSARTYGVVTKSNTTPLDFTSLYIGGTGHVNISNDGGLTTTLFSDLPVGAILNVTGNRVMSTSTTATLIVWMR